MSIEQDIEGREDVTISVERMMRFCYLVQIQQECARSTVEALPLHLTRFGTLVFETASFLYSLFEDRQDGINLLRVWQDFEHPFETELQDLEKRLHPFKDELRLVRNRIGFHGSSNRERERAGLGIFDVDTSRARDYASLVLDMRQLCVKMIGWYMQGMDDPRRAEMWKEFVTEMKQKGSFSG